MLVKYFYISEYIANMQQTIQIHEEIIVSTTDDRRVKFLSNLGKALLSCFEYLSDQIDI